jgi:hypothetical protein
LDLGLLAAAFSQSFPAGMALQSVKTERKVNEPASG